uniref:P-type domain-containing protein n=1 Tax=Sinocyclocheilus anshuiensis TaxID=1608454 RepID=A0A671MMC2_9TELE
IIFIVSVRLIIIADHCCCPLDKCAVADYEQIQCGQPGISGAECEAINCCFNGQQQQTNQQFPQKFQQPVAKAEPLDKCAVGDYEQIQCGQPGISGAQCEAINCCFNGQQCYYGKAVVMWCMRTE